MENIKNVITISISAVLAYFQPIYSVLIVIMAILGSNFIFGLLSGIIADKENFDNKKAFYCFFEGMVLFGLIAFIYFIGEKMETESIVQCISVITYALIWFYGVNILKNLKKLFPTNQFISFLYYVLSIEFVNHVPFLDKFLSIHKTKEEDNGN